MNKEDINFDDEYLKKMKSLRPEKDELTEEMKAEIKTNYSRIFKNKFMRKKYDEHLKEAKEFQAKFPLDVY